MPKNRSVNWLALAFVVIGLALVGVPALWVYMTATARPLHPTPNDVPSVSHSDARSAPGMETARQIVRATVAEKNLPGVSLAVGIDGDTR